MSSSDSDDSCTWSGRDGSDGDFEGMLPSEVEHFKVLHASYKNSALHGDASRKQLRGYYQQRADARRARYEAQRKQKADAEAAFRQAVIDQQQRDEKLLQLQLELESVTAEEEEIKRMHMLPPPLESAKSEPLVKCEEEEDEHMAAAASDSPLISLSQQHQQPPKLSAARLEEMRLAKERDASARNAVTAACDAIPSSKRKGERRAEYLNAINPANGHAASIRVGEIFDFAGHEWSVQDIVSDNQYVPGTNTKPSWPKWKLMDPNKPRPDFIAERIDIEDGYVISDTNTTHRDSFVASPDRKEIWAVSISGGEDIMKTYMRERYIGGVKVKTASVSDVLSGATPLFTFNRNTIAPNGKPLCRAEMPVRMYTSKMEKKYGQKRVRGGSLMTLEEAQQFDHSPDLEDAAMEIESAAGHIVKTEAPPAKKPRTKAAPKGKAPAAAAATTSSSSSYAAYHGAAAAASSSSTAAAGSVAHPQIHIDAVHFVEHSLIPSLQEQVTRDGRGDVAILFECWRRDGKCVDEEGGLVNLVKRVTKDMVPLSRYSERQKKDVPSHNYSFSMKTMIEMCSRVYLFSTEDGLNYMRACQARLTAESVASTKCSVA